MAEENSVAGVAGTGFKAYAYLRRPFCNDTAQLASPARAGTLWHAAWTCAAVSAQRLGPRAAGNQIIKCMGMPFIMQFACDPHLLPRESVPSRCRICSLQLADDIEGALFYA